MPHKVGKNKWKWGNIERSSKGDLAKTVYGIWRKNGGKGDFGTFWRTGKTSSSKSKKNESLHPLDFQINKAIQDSYLSMYSSNHPSVDEDFSSFTDRAKAKLRKGRDKAVELKNRAKDRIKDKVDVDALRQKARDASEITKAGWEGFKEGLGVGAHRTGAEIASGFERLGSGAARLVGKDELADDWDSKTDKFVDDTYDEHSLGYEDTLTDLGRVGGSMAGTALPMAATVWAGDAALKGAGTAIRNIRDMQNIKSLPSAVSKGAGSLPKSAPKSLPNPKTLSSYTASAPKPLPKPLPKPTSLPSAQSTPYSRLSPSEKKIVDDGMYLYGKALRGEGSDIMKRYASKWMRVKDALEKVGPVVGGTLGGAAAGYGLANVDGDEGGSTVDSNASDDMENLS